MKKLSHTFRRIAGVTTSIAIILISAHAATPDSRSLIEVGVPHSDLRREIAETPAKSGGIYFAYPVMSDSAAKAPKGYKPVFINHYGRHGSRWAIDLSQYDLVDSIFRIEQEAGNLTDLGEKLMTLNRLAGAHAQGHSGELSPLGERQHRGIAERMLRRYPTLFSPGVRIEAFSSVEPRCIISMAAFCERLKEIDPSLRIQRHATPGDMAYIAYSTPEAKKQGKPWAPWRIAFSERYDSLTLCDATARKIFIDPSRLGNQSLFMRKLHDVAIALQDIDGLEFDMLGYFDTDDLYNLWQANNHIMYYRHAFAGGNGNHGVKSATSLLRRLIEESDIALSDSESVPPVILHFGHDTNLIRLLALMDMKGCAEKADNPDDYAEAWQAFRVAPMGANLQMIFYRKSFPTDSNHNIDINKCDTTDDIIVTIRHNEQPAKITGVSEFAPGFYSWPKLKAYWTSRISHFNSTDQ